MTIPRYQTAPEGWIHEFITDQTLTARWRGVEEIDLSRRAVNHRHIEEVLNNPNLEEVKSLDLSGVPIGLRGARAICASRLGARLVELRLNGCRFGARAIEALVQAVRYPMLEALSLRGNCIGQRGARELIETRAMPRLQRLAVDAEKLGAKGIWALRDAPHLRHIFGDASRECLEMTPSERFSALRDIVYAPPSEASWSRLCRLVEVWPDEVFEQEVLPYLEGHLLRWPDELRQAPARWLRERSHIHPRWLKRPVLALARGLDLHLEGAWSGRASELLLKVADNPHLKELRHLAGLTCGPKGAEAEALNSAPFMALRALSFKPTYQRPFYPEAFGAARWPARLSHLAFESCTFHSAGRAFEALPHLPNLRHLSFRRCGFGLKGAQRLLHELEGLEGLRHLSLVGCDLGWQEARWLAGAHGLDRLAILDLGDNALSDEGVEALRERFGARVRV